MANLLWHANEGLNSRIRTTDEAVIAAVSSELMSIYSMVKESELARTDQKKVTTCYACGQKPMLPITTGHTAHTCAGCQHPIHSAIACPVARVFASKDSEGTFYCHLCAPPNSQNNESHTPAAARKQPFTARSVSDPHTPIGTRADAQDAIAQRLKERASVQEVTMGESPEDPSTPPPGPAGPASNPYRMPEVASPAATPSPEQQYTHRILVTAPDNKIAMDDDVVAVQFHEACLDMDIPDFSEQCSAICVGHGQKGPWLISVSATAFQAVQSDEMKTFDCFTSDGACITLRVLPCDIYGKPIRTSSNRSDTDTHRTMMKQKADDVKLLIVMHLPRRCLGKYLDTGSLESVRERIETVVKKMPGTKHGLTQGLTPNMKKKKNSLNLFLNPPLNMEDPYRHIRPHLPELKCFPYVGDGLHPEAITAFMPPTTAQRLGVRPCCFLPPDICDSKAREGSCRVKQDTIDTWGWNSPRSAPPEDSRTERKRARQEMEHKAAASAEAVKAFRVNSIKKKLCKLFSQGKVGATPEPPAKPHIHTPHPPPPVQQLGVPDAARLRLREEAYRLRFCTIPHAHQQRPHPPHVPLHRGWRGKALPIPKSRPGLRIDTRHRDDQLTPDRLPPTRVGPEVHPTRRPTRRQRVPLQAGKSEGGGVGKLHRQQGGFPSPAASPLPVPALRRSSRLARRFARGAQPRRIDSRRWVHERALRLVVPGIQTPAAPVRAPRSDRERVPFTHGAPQLGHRPTVACTFGRRRAQRLRPRSSPFRVLVVLVDRVLWYTSNILWLQGRLPWNIDRLCLG